MGREANFQKLGGIPFIDADLQQNSFLQTFSAGLSLKTAGFEVIMSSLPTVP